jgi:hypothetical protein
MTSGLSSYSAFEVDGSQHLDLTEHDAACTGYFAKRGYTELRFFNREVLNDIERVLGVILEWLQTVKNNCRVPKALPFGRICPILKTLQAYSIFWPQEIKIKGIKTYFFS